MANLDALLSGSATKGTRMCLLGKQARELQEPYLSAYQNLLEGELASQVVSFRLREAGLKGSPVVVQYHRRGICGCPQETNA
jgi:hypothetical protein